MPQILIINGPNLNLLGAREPETYGSTTLAEIEDGLRQRFSGRCEMEFFQSNHEGELIDRVQSVLGNDDVIGFVMNPGGFTHTSVALRDAVAAVDKPFIEVHLSNVFAREEFRHVSYFSDLAAGVISGLGPAGYGAAVDVLLERASA